MIITFISIDIIFNCAYFFISKSDNALVINRIKTSALIIFYLGFLPFICKILKTEKSNNLLTCTTAVLTIIILLITIFNKFIYLDMSIVNELLYFIFTIFIGTMLYFEFKNKKIIISIACLIILYFLISFTDTNYTISHPMNTDGSLSTIIINLRGLLLEICTEAELIFLLLSNRKI